MADLGNQLEGVGDGLDRFLDSLDNASIKLGNNAAVEARIARETEKRYKKEGVFKKKMFEAEQRRLKKEIDSKNKIAKLEQENYKQAMALRPLRKRLADSIKSEVKSKVLLLKNIKEEIKDRSVASKNLKGFANNLNTFNKKTLKGLTDGFTKAGKGVAGAASGLWKSMKKILGNIGKAIGSIATGGLLGALILGVKVVFDTLLQTDAAMAKVAKRTGMTRDELDGVRVAAEGAQSTFSQWGVTLDQAAQEAGNLVEQFGAAHFVTQELVETSIKLQKAYGVSSEDAGKLVEVLERAGASSNEFMLNVGVRSQKALVSSSLVMRDLASRSQQISIYTERGREAMIEMAVEAAKAGSSLDAMSGMKDAFSDVDTIAENMMHLGLATSKSFTQSLGTAHELFLLNKQGPEGRLEIQRRLNKAMEQEFKVLENGDIVRQNGAEIEEYAWDIMAKQSGITVEHLQRMRKETHRRRVEEKEVAKMNKDERKAWDKLQRDKKTAAEMRKKEEERINELMRSRNSIMDRLGNMFSGFYSEFIVQMGKILGIDGDLYNGVTQLETALKQALDLENLAADVEDSGWFGAIKKRLESLWVAAKKGFAEAMGWDDAKAGDKSMWERVSDAIFGPGIKMVSSALDDVWSGIYTTLEDLLSSGWASLKGILSESWVEIKIVMSNLWYELKDIMGDLWFDLTNILADAWVKLENVFDRMKTDLMTAIDWAFGGIDYAEEEQRRQELKAATTARNNRRQVEKERDAEKRENEKAAAVVARKKEQENIFFGPSPAGLEGDPFAGDIVGDGSGVMAAPITSPTMSQFAVDLSNIGKALGSVGTRSKLGLVGEAGGEVVTSRSALRSGVGVSGKAASELASIGVPGYYRGDVVRSTVATGGLMGALGSPELKRAQAQAYMDEKKLQTEAMREFWRRYYDRQKGEIRDAAIGGGFHTGLPTSPGAPDAKDKDKGPGAGEQFGSWVKYLFNNYPGLVDKSLQAGLGAVFKESGPVVGEMYKGVFRGMQAWSAGASSKEALRLGVMAGMAESLKEGGTIRGIMDGMKDSNQALLVATQKTNEEREEDIQNQRDILSNITQELQDIDEKTLRIQKYAFLSPQYAKQQLAKLDRQTKILEKQEKNQIKTIETLEKVDKQVEKSVTQAKLQYGLMQGFTAGLDTMIATFQSGGSWGDMKKQGLRKGLGMGIKGLVQSFGGDSYGRAQEYLSGTGWAASRDMKGNVIGAPLDPKAAINRAEAQARSEDFGTGDLKVSVKTGATGKYVNSPTLMMVGEEGRSEVVVPTERIRKGLPINKGVAAELGSIGVPGFANGGKTTPLSPAEAVGNVKAAGWGGNAGTAAASAALSFADAYMRGGNMRQAGVQAISAGVGAGATAALMLIPPPGLGAVIGPLLGPMIGKLAGPTIGRMFGMIGGQDDARKRTRKILENAVKGHALFDFGSPPGLKKQMRIAIGGKENAPTEKNYNKLIDHVSETKLLKTLWRNNISPELLVQLGSSKLRGKQAFDSYAAINTALYGHAAGDKYMRAVAVPQLADGGIVTKPTTAIVGEKGPEMIIPLHEQKQSNEDMIKELKKQNELMLKMIQTQKETGKTEVRLDGRVISETVGENFYDIGIGM